MEEFLSKLVKKLLNVKIFKSVIIATIISMVIAITLGYMMPIPKTIAEMFTYLFNDPGKYLLSIAFTFITSVGLAWLSISIICSFKNIREFIEHFVYIEEDEDLILNPNFLNISIVIILIVLSFYFLSCAFRLMIPFIIFVVVAITWGWFSSYSRR